MGRLLVLLLAAVFLLAAGSPAAAQETHDEAAAVPARLTLEDALRLARARNPAYRKVLNDLDVLAAEERVGWGALLPSLTTDLRLSGSSSRIATGQDDFGQPRTLPDPIDFTSSSSTQGVFLRLDLFDGFTNLNDLRAARAASRAAEARARAGAARLGADVSRRFYAALHARGLIELEERLLVSARDRLAATERLVRVVAATAVDVLGARVDVARQEQALARARGEARKAELELREALGIAGDVAFELAGDFPGVFDPSTLAADALVAAALAGHPRIAEADAAAAAAQRRARAARGTRWPQIGLNAGLSRGMSLSSYDALTELNPKNRTFFFGLSASLPLFEQFRPSAQIARAEAAVSDSREDARAARLALEREVRSALIDLENAHRSLELADQSAALSGERVALAQEQYRQGAIPFTSLQSVIEQAAAAEREAAAARLTFATALVTLEEKVGKELRP